MNAYKDLMQKIYDAFFFLTGLEVRCYFRGPTELGRTDIGTIGLKIVD